MTRCSRPARGSAGNTSLLRDRWAVHINFQLIIDVDAVNGSRHVVCLTRVFRFLDGKEPASVEEPSNSKTRPRVDFPMTVRQNFWRRCFRNGLKKQQSSKTKSSPGAIFPFMIPSCLAHETVTRAGSLQALSNSYIAIVQKLSASLRHPISALASSTKRREKHEKKTKKNTNLSPC